VAHGRGSKYGGGVVVGRGSTYGGANLVGSKYGASPTPPPFDPTDIDGLTLWLASDTGVTVDGSSNVTAWADQSGKGYDAGPAVNSPPGNFVLTPSSFGSKPGLVSADGAELACGTNILPLGSARTVFVVANVASADSGCILLSTCPSAHANTAVFSCGLWNFSNSGTIYPYTDGIAVSESTGASPSSFEGAAKVSRLSATSVPTGSPWGALLFQRLSRHRSAPWHLRAPSVGRYLPSAWQPMDAGISERARRTEKAGRIGNRQLNAWTQVPTAPARSPPLTGTSASTARAPARQSSALPPCDRERG